jgi:hypothetical protein
MRMGAPRGLATRRVPPPTRWRRGAGRLGWAPPRLQWTVEPSEDVEQDPILAFQVGDDGPDFIVRHMVDPIIFFRHNAIFWGQPILAHHDDRCRVGRLEGEGQVEQDKG